MLPAAATDFYRAQQRVNAATARAAAMHWRRMGDDFDASWRRVGPGILSALVEAQQQMTTRAATYVPRVLAETNIPDRPVADFRPDSLVGIASDGRRLDTLAYGAVTTAKTAAAAGATPEQALAAGGNWLDLMTKLQVADAARQAVSILTASRKNLSGTVRVLNPPSCQRCAILAGRFYRWSTGFQRHPRCFPAGTVVSGPGSLGASRRWYEGELLTLRTASGKHLSITGNHPVLTRRGWVPANLVLEGDEVVSRASGDRSRALLVPDEDQMPARIEDVWRSGVMDPLGGMPVAPEDFHGDGVGSGHVDVVLADGLLGDRRKSTLLKQAGEQELALGAVLAITLAGASSNLEMLETVLATSASRVRGLGLQAPRAGGHLASAEQASLARTSDLDLGFDQSAANQFARHAQSLRQGVLALATEIGGDDRLRVDAHPSASRWDAPASPFSGENSAAYASSGLDLLARLAGQVELDRVVEVTRVSWSGHVYNLTSSEGWYDAEGVIVSNCDCVNLPSQNAGWAQAEGFITDPMDAYRTGQIRDLTGAQIKALSEGADITKVVNATRGMSTTATRRVGKAAEGTVLAAAPGTLDLLAPLRRAQVARGGARAADPGLLTPEGIYQQAAGDRDKAIALLREWGYLT